MLPLFDYLDSTETTIEGSGVAPDIPVAFLVEDLVSGSRQTHLFNQDGLMVGNRVCFNASYLAA